MNNQREKATLAVLSAADLTTEEFCSLVKDLAFDERDEGKTRILAEAPDGWAFDYYSREPDTELTWYQAGKRRDTMSIEALLERTTAGRIFAPSGELKWREVTVEKGRRLRTVMLGANDWSSGVLKPKSCPEICWREPQKYFLWGQRSERAPEEWIELRIPHRFCYPVDCEDVSAKPRGVQVICDVWSDAEGLPHFIRFCDLEEVSAEDSEKDNEES